RARQNLAQGRLSRSVVADEAQNLAGAQHEVDAIERLDRAERLADVLHAHTDRSALAHHREILPSALAPEGAPTSVVRLLEEAAELVDVLLRHDRDRDVDARVYLLALLQLEDRLDAGDAFLEGVLLHHRHDPSVVDAFDRLGGEIPAEDLDLVRLLLA